MNIGTAYSKAEIVEYLRGPADGLVEARYIFRSPELLLKSGWLYQLRYSIAAKRFYYVWTGKRGGKRAGPQ